MKFTNSMGKKYFDKKMIKNGVFTKTVKAEHFFFKYNGWGLAVETLNALQEEGVEDIVIRCPENGTEYRTTVTKFMDDGKSGEFGKAGKQKFLPLYTNKTPNYKILGLS